MGIKAFLEQASWPEIVSRISRLAANSEGQEAGELLEMMRTVLPVNIRFQFARFVAAALVQQGPEGVRLLREALYDAPHTTHANATLEALYYASKGGVSPSLRSFGDSVPEVLLQVPLPETTTLARIIFEDVILESQNIPDLFDRIIFFLHSGTVLESIEKQEGGDNQRGRLRDDVLRIMRDSALQLRPRLISDFRKLIDARSSEQSYQAFLTDHPVLLDALADYVISKQKLGIEHVTDFALHRLDDEYVLVEIEKPHDPIFTKANDFAAPFVHALGQVLDFRSWIGQHTEYARTLMPGISATPPGMLVIGLRTNLTEVQSLKLRAFNENSLTIRIVTFDDLASQAETIYKNMTRRQ
jgi:hypothetical protein